jgi:hypothetical protein
MRLSMLTAVVAGLSLFPGWAQAQIKLPVYAEDKANSKNVVFQEATRRDDFQHGKMLAVTLTGAKEPVRGVLVRVDRTNGRIYLRTKPGSAPRAISESEIKRVEKGVIQEAAFKGDVTAPEIEPFVIYNGARKTVSYLAPTLSPGEIARLRELEAAENEMARLESLATLERRVLETEIAIQTGQEKMLNLVTDLLWKQQGPTANSPMFAPFGTYPLFVGFPSVQQIVYDQWPSSTNFAAASLPMVRQGTTAIPNTSPTADSLGKARQSYAAAQRNAVIEDGRLIAVITENQDK